ncbi:hypothetical protein [Melittangium boletus]|uniref:hypothetical protein n=1 Tax=Melittangium boletus TaxID=83453 RepID=UPI003DA47BD6
MMRRGGLFLGSALLISMLGSACGEPEPARITAETSEQLIDAVGASTTITLSVVDEDGKKATGVVRATTKMGEFGDQGNNTLVTLENGSASLPFSCHQERYPECGKGLARVSLKWRDASTSVKVYVGDEGKALLEKGSDSDPEATNGGSGGGNNMLSSLSAGQVYYFGSAGGEGAGGPRVTAISPVLAPTRQFTGVVGSMQMRGDGRLVYSSGGKLFLSTPDPFTESPTNTTLPPSNVTANDTVIPTTRCAGSVYHFATTSGTDIYYKCEYDGAYFNLAGAEVVPAGTYFILAVAGGSKLVTDSGRRLSIFTAAKKQINAHSPANPSAYSFVHSTARARGGDFDLVYNGGTILQLWRIDSATGVYTKLATYADRAKDTVFKTWSASSDSYWVMDAGGNIYMPVTKKDSKTPLYGIARTSYGGASALVLDPANRPPGTSWDQWPPRLYTEYQGGSLLTGP